MPCIEYVCLRGSFVSVHTMHYELCIMNDEL